MFGFQEEDDRGIQPPSPFPRSDLEVEPQQIISRALHSLFSPTVFEAGVSQRRLLYYLGNGLVNQIPLLQVRKDYHSLAVFFPPFRLIPLPKNRCCLARFIPQVSDLKPPSPSEPKEEPGLQQPSFFIEICAQLA